jgi:hypothetical protein
MHWLLFNHLEHAFLLNTRPIYELNFLLTGCKLHLVTKTSQLMVLREEIVYAGSHTATLLRSLSKMLSYLLSKRVVFILATVL